MFHLGGGGQATAGRAAEQVLALLEEYRVAAFYELFNTTGLNSPLSHNAARPDCDWLDMEVKEKKKRGGNRATWQARGMPVAAANGADAKP